MSNIIDLAEARYAREKRLIAFAFCTRETYFYAPDGTPYSKLMQDVVDEFSGNCAEIIADLYWHSVATFVAQERGVNLINQAFARSLDVAAHHAKVLASAKAFLHDLPNRCGGRSA